ncbi:MAG: DUF3656 domain-containing protein [Firmicutes bacterium]|nr:DUF3656 domain-containing protein [Bacillota bacterium]
MDKKVELLAPAGGLEQLKAAIYNGADAIYFGGEKFSARANATNFNKNEIIIARRLTKKHNIKLYCAINTVIFNNELEEVINYIAFLSKVGIDALIVQDIGLITLVKEYFPDMEIHSSTQLSIQNTYGLEFLKTLGVKRAVLPRESSLKDILKMKNSGIELEAFVHGAICICFSGQCLMSSMIGGRSGNRGACAQPCRLKYNLIDYKSKEVICENASYLSPKDMMLINSVDKLIEAGIKSFKIEGRMKTPEYVATIIKFYRMAIDKALSGEELNLTQEENNEIAQVFSRDFTDSYLYGKSGKDMMNVNKPNNRGTLAGRVQNFKDGKVSVLLKTPIQLGDKLSFWTTVEGRVNISVDRINKEGVFVDSAEAKDIVTLDIPKRVNRDDRIFKTESAYNKAIIEKQINSFNIDEKISLDIEMYGQVGEPLTMEFIDEDGFKSKVVSEIILEEALKHPLNEESLRTQIRLGDTSYILRDLKLNVGHIMVPKSVLNNMRRDGIKSIIEKREEHFNFKHIEIRSNINEKNLIAKRPKIGVIVESIDKIKELLVRDVDYIYYPLINFKNIGSSAIDFLNYIKLLSDDQRKIIVLDLPRFIREDDMAFILSQIDMFKPYIYSFRANTVDHIIMLKSLGIHNIHGNSSLNIVNSVAYNFYKNILSLTEIELSKELNIAQLYDLNNSAQLTIYGITELMIMEHCLIGSEIGPKKCKERIYALKDRIDVEFPILVDEIGKNHIINSRKLMIIDELIILMETGYHNFILNFIMTDIDILREIIDIYIAVIRNHKNITKAKDEIFCLESNLTKGHFNRGII